VDLLSRLAAEACFSGVQQRGGRLVRQGADPLGRMASRPWPAAAEKAGEGAGGRLFDLAGGHVQQRDLGVGGQ
jgi:hypothetical protein